MIDLHTHILPGIDDGPADMQGSLAFARAALAAGTTTMVATPHVDGHYRLGVADRDAALASLRVAMAQEGIGLRVEPGAEISLDRYVDLQPEEIEQLTLGAGPYLLLEAPLSPAVGAFDSFLGSLLARGVRMVIAHPERCPTFQRHPEKLAELVRAGALTQLTAASLEGRFGRAVREASLNMLAAGLVHDLASDAHDAEHRGPEMRAGLEAAESALPGSAALADWLTVDAPGAILAGAPLPPRPPLPVPPPKRRLGLLRRR